MDYAGRPRSPRKGARVKMSFDRTGKCPICWRRFQSKECPHDWSYVHRVMQAARIEELERAQEAAPSHDGEAREHRGRVLGKGAAPITPTSGPSTDVLAKVREKLTAITELRAEDFYRGDGDNPAAMLAREAATMLDQFRDTTKMVANDVLAKVREKIVALQCLTQCDDYSTGWHVAWADCIALLDREMEER